MASRDGSKEVVSCMEMEGNFQYKTISKNETKAAVRMYAIHTQTTTISYFYDSVLKCMLTMAACNLITYSDIYGKPNSNCFILFM